MADDLAALLAEHREPSEVCSADGWYYACGCKKVLPVEHPQRFSMDGCPPEIWEVFAAHQAAVIAASGWVRGREEWGVSTRGAHYWINPVSTYKDPVEAEALAAKWREHSVGARVMSRYVTDWEEVLSET